MGKLPPESWRPSGMGNLRKTDRTGEREIERLAAFLRSEARPDWAPVKIRDYSMSGFGIHHPYLMGREIALPGERVELKVAGAWEEEIVIPCEIQNSQGAGNEVRLGLERTDLRGAEERDPKRRFAIPSEAQPTARVANPIIYNEWADASLIGFSGGGEWIFQSTDMGLLLLPGLPVRILFDLPLETDGECAGRIAWARLGDGHRIEFALQWSEISFEVSNAVGEHLLRHGACNPRSLPRFGIRLKRFKDQLRFTFMSTREEYERVLSLRQQAYVLAGKLDKEVEPSRLATPFDGRSRILAAFHGETMVACVGLTFAPDDSAPLRSEGEFPGKAYPVRVPPKSAMIEVHSLCTRGDYRGGDLIRGMFEQIARSLLLSERDWFITFATDELWPLYRKIGFRKLGAKVAIASLNGLDHHLILMHRSSLIHGRGMTLFAWNYFFGDLIHDLLDKQYLAVSAPQRLLILVKSLFAKTTKRWADRRLEKDYQAFMWRAAVREGAHA